VVDVTAAVEAQGRFEGDDRLDAICHHGQKRRKE
jgi:hypothetical protein